MAGVEAVARVAHPTQGLLTPDQFLKGADESVLIDLSRLALVNAVRLSAQLQETGIAMQVAINISVDELLRLPVADLVAMHRPERSDWLGIILEIPERQVISKIESLKPRFPTMHKAGVSIAIDNFGCGSSSLSILNQIPFAEIKIDRSLVQGCASDAGLAKICKTVIQTAHNFGSKAVAVGVATEPDRATLTALGCDLGQGFLLGKPLRKSELDALIAEFNSRSSAANQAQSIG